MNNRDREGRQSRSSLLTTGVLVLLGFLVLGGGLWRELKTPAEPDPEAGRAARRARRKAPEPAPAEVPTTAFSGERTMPIAAVGMEETAAAMDWTGLRFQVNRLRMAALEGNPAGRESAAAGVQLYGVKAARFLDEEIARESDPVVRWALQDARKGLK